VTLANSYLAGHNHWGVGQCTRNQLPKQQKHEEHHVKWCSSCLLS